MTPDELENRLILFSVQIIEISNHLSKNYAGRHMAGQIIRSGTSPALNYGEVRAAESKKDFVHKTKVVLKELRETGISLRIIRLTKLYTEEEEGLLAAQNECNELISIFVRSVKTAQGSE